MQKLQAILKYLNHKGIFPWEAYLDRDGQCLILCDLAYIIDDKMQATLNSHFNVFVSPRYEVTNFLWCVKRNWVELVEYYTCDNEGVWHDNLIGHEA
jgi:hypothetical protein